jgi:hypothetical protein
MMKSPSNDLIILMAFYHKFHPRIFHNLNILTGFANRTSLDSSFVLKINDFIEKLKEKV